jgi:hypothetical protein
MSGPFGVSITVIGGQKLSGEMVVAASSLLDMRFLYIDPVATASRLRPEFLNVLRIFRYRERLDPYTPPEEFVQRLVPPSNTLSTEGLFWLALDLEGEALAKDIFVANVANGESPDTQVYHSVHKLNLLVPRLPAPPQVRQTLWQKLFPSSPDPRAFRKSHLHLSYIDRTTPLTAEQKQYYIWFEALYEALIPWMDIIKKIQSDYS